ncbi:MAG: helix-turn-helix domain-containing protein [Aquaticitalea sp.]
MITITSNINDIHSFFKTLKTEIGGTLTSNSNEYTFQLDRQLGDGSIRSINLEEGISVLEFSLNVNQDIQITVDSLLGSHVNFIYCSKGKLSHSFEKNNDINTIETFQTSILTNIVSSNNTIILEKDVQTVATMISVNTKFESGTNCEWNMNLRDTFVTDKTDDFLYIGSYNLKIAENIKQLQEIKQEGLVRALLIKGFVNVILALEIEQHNRDIENSDLATTSLTKSEIMAIQELTAFIDNYPDLDHKVDNLTRKIGISAAKLQEGFKFKHGLTICEYIRHVRLTKSEELISNTDLNISEIVYSLGFSSRSYFSKIFKERFACSPSDYKKNKLVLSA